MDRNKWYIGWIACCLLLEACYDTKVDRFRLELLKQQILSLENWQQELNDHIIALQKLVDALHSEKYIQSCNETAEGYILVLNDQSVIRLVHGQKGADGKDGVVRIPQISVRDSSDGHTYWTMEGTILRDTNGKAVRADGDKGGSGEQGVPGEWGEDGIVPQIRINSETDMWEISQDRGLSWSSTGVKATGAEGEAGTAGTDGPGGPGGQPGISGPPGEQGPPGEGIFAKDGIDVQEAFVDFKLADGTTFRIPRYQEWHLDFPEGLEYQVAIGAKRMVPFHIKGFGGTPEVNSVGDHGWLAEVQLKDSNVTSGEIIVTAPEKSCRGTVLVFLSNGDGNCRTFTLSFSSL